MKFREAGKYNPKASAYPYEVQPIEFAKQSPLKRLDFLLGLVCREKPEIISDYTSKLYKEYKEKTITLYLDSEDKTITNMIEPFKNLKNYPELAYYSFNFFLNVLAISNSINWKQEKIKVPQRNFLKSALVPRYMNLQILSDVIGREEAIYLYKKYITEFILHGDEDKEDKHFDLKSLSNHFFKFNEENESESWVTIYSEPSRGKLVFRKDVCLWNEVLTDLTDLEFKYLICCYGDFQGIKMENKNFILTMEHTIAKGDPYCSCVVHDTSIDWEIKHPPKNFWDDIWPLHEWQEKQNDS